MNHWIWTLYERHRQTSALAVAGLGALFLALALYWGISGLVLLPKTNAIEASIKSNTVMLATQRSSSPSVRPSQSDGVVSGPSAIAELQQTLVTDAQAGNCTILQYTPDPRPGPYISAYGVQAGDFGAYHIKTSITGNLGSILACLQRLAQGSVPFEIEEMSISGSGQPTSQNETSVALTLLVVTKAAPAPTGGA